MEDKMLRALTMCETDVDGALKRFSGDEELYLACLNAFLKDTTANELSAAIEAHEWDEAFTAAHALKGLAGNMGFVPLFHAAAELVVLIRAGRMKDIDASNEQVRRSYMAIVSAIVNGAA